MTSHIAPKDQRPRNPESKFPSFSIVIPTFRRPDALHETLTALAELHYPADRWEVIVVDDAAEEGTADVIAGVAKGGLKIRLESQRQLGAASARNRGARQAQGEYILFNDDDMIVEPDHLQLHVRTHSEHPNAVVSGVWEFAPRIEAELERTAFGRYRIDLERGYQRDVKGQPLPEDPSRVVMPLLGAGNLSLRRELFTGIGGFDEKFPLAGAEDQDFSLRARGHGAVLLLDRNIRCFQNDNRISFESYAAREERSAQTVPFMARKYPEEFAQSAYVRENRPVSASDPPRLIAKKLTKRLLSVAPILRALHVLGAIAAGLPVPERVLRRFYSSVLGLHLFRGFRQTWEP